MVKLYKSSMVFLPPETNSSLNISSLLTGEINLPSSSILNNYYELNTEQLRLIIESGEIKKKLIDKYGLIQSYEVTKSKQPYAEAAKILKKRIKVEMVEHSGLGFSEIVGFEISFTDTSAVRAKEMLCFYFSEIQSVVNRISNEKARHIREFIEGRLEKNRVDLESAKQKLMAFQMQNKVLDLPIQVREAVRMYADLKSSIQLKSIELELSRGDFSRESRATSVLENQIAAMVKRLSALENKAGSDYMMGLENAPALSYAFLELSKDVEMYQSLDLVLQQTNEIAKIQEVKVINTLQIIDPAGIPEYKYKPKRSLVVLCMVAAEMLFVIFMLMAQYYYKTVLVESDEYQRILTAFKNL